MKQEIRLHLPRSWEEVKQQVAVPMGFDGDVIQYQLKTRIQEAWKGRAEWVAAAAPTIVNDMRTPIMGENWEDIIYSDMDGAESKHDEDMENDSDLEFE